MAGRITLTPQELRQSATKYTYGAQQILLKKQTKK